MKKTLIILPIVLVAGLIGFRFFSRLKFKSDCKKKGGSFVKEKGLGMFKQEFCKY